MLIRSAEAFGWLVLPLVFKTNVGREERPGGVRFPYVSAILDAPSLVSHRYMRNRTHRYTTRKPALELRNLGS